MGFHSFSLDPRMVLGVGPEASLEEIHDAYRAKSKKHHPDCGGDEWAFRMVTRAYEVLKTTATATAGPMPGTWDGRNAAADESSAGRSAAWSWSWAARSQEEPAAADQDQSDADASGRPWPGEAGPAASGEEPDGARKAWIDPARIRTVDVELIWTRFEKDGPARVLDDREADAATLSVCMVVSWPEAGLVDRTAEFPAAAEILRALIELFERLRGQNSVVAARSRIEDGRFVGWISYPDVLAAQDAILAVRDAFRTHGLAIKLQTRDERIPFDWHAEAHAPVLSQAS